MARRLGGGLGAGEVSEGCAGGGGTGGVGEDGADLGDGVATAAVADHGEAIGGEEDDRAEGFET